MRLTDISLRSLRPRSEQYAVFDDTMSNFGVRVGTTGKLSFFVMYRTNGQRKRGPTPVWWTVEVLGSGYSI
jgi:hypothetical protein